MIHQDQKEFDFDANSPTVGEQKLHDFKQLCDDLLRFKVDIDAALSYSRNSHSFDDVVGKVLAGRYHLYTLPNSFIIMEVHDMPNFKVYHGYLAGGDLKEILNFQPTLIENAKQLGCIALSIAGRRGWEKPLKAIGWQHDLSHLYLEF